MTEERVYTKFNTGGGGVLDNPTFEERNIKYWSFHQHENTKKDKK